MRVSSLGKDDYPNISEHWYFVLLLLLLSKLQELHLLNYYDVTQESIAITLFIRACNVCDVLCVITSVMTPCNDLG
jgi:hypothetical protein